MDEMQGVMALPEAQGAGMRPEDMAIFEQIRQTIPRQEITKEFLAAGEQADPQAVAEFKQELAGLELTPDELNKLNTMVDAILAAPQDYASLRRAYLAEGMPEDLLPEQFDPAFFAALNMAIDTIAMNPGSPPPMAMAMGGVADLAAYGRNGDTMLAHITPREAAMLKRMGGSGTINPYTGLPEYASIFKKIGNAVKKFAKSTVGKVIIGAALGFFVGPAAASFLGVTSTAGMAAVSGFVGGAGSTLAAGGGLKNALRSGALAALTAGAGAAITGGAAAFEPRPVFGGQNANIFGFGQPEVAPPTGVGTAAEIAAAPSSAVGAAPLPDQIAMLEANMAPQGYGSGYETGLRQGPPPGASAAELADYGRRHAMATVFNPSPDANLVQDVLGSRTSPVSLDTGNLRPVPTGVGTAADIVGTPEMQIGQYSAPVPDRIPGVSPFGSQVSQQTIPAVDNPLGINVRPSPPAPLADPRFGGNFVSQADRFGAEIPLDTGNLRPVDLTGEVAKNTESGTYSPQGKFTPASAGRGPILDAAYPELSVKTGATSGGGVMDTLREGYGKVENFYDKYISPDRYANNPNALAKAAQAGEAAQSSAFNTAYNKALLTLPENATATQLEAAKGLAFQAGQDAYKTAYDKALQSAMPGAFTRYAPLAALGIGALGAMGGFKTKDATPPDMALFRGPTPQQLAAARLYYGGIRPTSYGSMYLPGGYAEGGGVMDTPQAMRVGGKTYPRKIGAINGPGTGTSDSIPAMLSDGEFVFTAKAVRAMGNGSRRKGAKKMYKLMKMLEGKAA